MTPFARKLLKWFAANKRDLPWRRNRSIYRVWISEIMLQQTQVATVVPYYNRFVQRFPSVRRLAAASEQAVLKSWEGLGFYARARNLHRAARRVVADHGGRIPRAHAGFLALPGVGDYVAAAVLSIADGQALPAVDGNVLRVVARHAGVADDIRSTRARYKVRGILRDLIPAQSPGAFNEAMMELGATTCTPRGPRCLQCPLQDGCFARANNCAGDLPRKGKRKRVPLVRCSVAVLMRDGRIFIQQRRSEGLLGGLWEFPGGKARPAESPREALRRECREELCIAPRIVHEFPVVLHAYSHFRIELTPFLCEAPDQSVRTDRPHRWIVPSALSRYPFPSANRKFFPALTGYLRTLPN